MQYIELTVTSFLQRDTHYTEAYELIARKINKAMFLDNELASYHAENRYKLYVFNTFQPVEPDKHYKLGRIYVFSIRTIDAGFADKISRLLKQANADDLKIIAIEKNIIKRHLIQSLQTITPVIITTEGNKNWIIGDDIELLQRRLGDNLEKKYNSFYQDKLAIKGDFIERLELLNRVPISLMYKNIKLLGSKLKIYIKPEEEYQKLAFIAEACGLGEKNSSIGSGYCNAQYLK